MFNVVLYFKNSGYSHHATFYKNKQETIVNFLLFCFVCLFVLFFVLLFCFVLFFFWVVYIVVFEVFCLTCEILYNAIYLEQNVDQSFKLLVPLRAVAHFLNRREKYHLQHVKWSDDSQGDLEKFNWLFFYWLLPLSLAFFFFFFLSSLYCSVWSIFVQLAKTFIIQSNWSYTEYHAPILPLNT